MKVRITEQLRVELGIPVKSAPLVNKWWNSMCYVDARCLRRYKRRFRKKYGKSLFSKVQWKWSRREVR